MASTLLQLHTYSNVLAQHCFSATAQPIKVIRVPCTLLQMPAGCNTLSCILIHISVMPLFFQHRRWQAEILYTAFFAMLFLCQIPRPFNIAAHA